METNTTTKDNEKLLRFSHGVILEEGRNIVNVDNNKYLRKYKWWEGFTKPKDAFNPQKTKGFLILKLHLHEYLNKISSVRSNNDDELMYPYLKILLNNVEVYRSRILDNNINTWDEELYLEIHYIKGKVEIQLYDMDETDEIVEDEYIGSALIDLTYLKVSKEYDMTIKYINQTATIINTHTYKKDISNNTNINKENEKVISKKNDEQNYNTLEKNSFSNNNIKSLKKTYKEPNEYSVRIIAKLINKTKYNVFSYILNSMSSLNYRCIDKTRGILDAELNVNKLYEELKVIKFNADTIWIPFYSIICNFTSWKTPVYSVFFVIFFLLSFIFSKLFISFFLLVLSLILFILVSIVRESYKLRREKNNKVIKDHAQKRNKYNFMHILKQKQTNQAKLLNKKNGNLSTCDSISSGSINSDNYNSENYNSDSSISDNESCSSSSNNSIDSNEENGSIKSFFMENRNNEDSGEGLLDSKSYTESNELNKNMRINNVGENEKDKEKYKLDTTKNKNKNIDSNNVDKNNNNNLCSEESSDDTYDSVSSLSRYMDDDNEDNYDKKKRCNNDNDNNTNKHSENNLQIIKTFISNLIDDDIINNIKYFHYMVHRFSIWSNTFYYILRKFGYFLIIITLLFSCLNIYFYSFVSRCLRSISCFVGFVLLTYNFKPTHVVYKFFLCIYEYYILKIRRRNVDIFTI
ncbi:hypothetical protein YYC_04691 [Plasmodium yoelii 17X]|uniref:C2 domain-containing protein n=3 Tax=Plasmodium yoelii TaxID=5861 RepID=A0AAE9WW49_PLAYO|nr:uncharacterized protein PY17X_0939500 [Plasmodium yoelii]ETB57899.1 hypothetical protein YYC_04691 [Plasmodium yoelii 17X]WBY57548.1 hypothetical protein Py17XNL_000900408 [Plasmodium yoelii yoelii]CDU18167.1 conserved Plasmodium protein, unknown function [Plasmodium yoelii]VTZ78584.1 conserved Plasmodium protein, unknown function [Plasmodium yoelii]|eukprot:XP_723898.2 uncharacterized protein PY17X_0939500 [Plasmodium yoelii]